MTGAEMLKHPDIISRFVGTKVMVKSNNFVDIRDFVGDNMFDDAIAEQ
jgi:hypothetical protein